MRGKTLNATQLKYIAIVAMTIDHIAWLLYPGFSREPIAIIMHIIGRLTAPIMWYFIAEGCYYSKDIRKYFYRLLGFAILSHFAFCFAFGISPNIFSGGIFNKTSVMLPLAMSVLLISIYKNEKIKTYLKVLSIALFCLLTFGADWSNIAMMMPFFLYFHREDKKKQIYDYIIWISAYVLVYVIFIDVLYGLLQYATLLSLPLLMRYDGTKGNGNSKWFFYWYYPLHMIIIGALRVMLYGDIALIF